MRIGIDGRLWYESGVGRYIRNLVMGFDKENGGHDFTVFLNSKAFNEIEFSNPRLKKVEADVKWHTISEQWKFKEILERQNLDLVHFPYFSYPVFYNRPFVITIHDLIIDHYPTGVSSSHSLPVYYAKYLAYKQITKMAVKNAMKIIVPSLATKNELIDHYKAKEEKLEVIYEGFDTKIKGGNYNKRISDNYILYVGNAYPHKNLKRLLSAFLAIKKKENIDLVCIGKDDFFYDKIESKSYGGIYFLHDVDDSSLFDYYTNAKLLVVPSLMEGFGLPLLEGMSLSCPVVCSDTPALREVGQDACFYFDPKSEIDLEKAILEVLSDNTLRNNLKRLSAKRVSDFSWKTTVSKTLKIYESCNSIRSGQ